MPVRSSTVIIGASARASFQKASALHFKIADITSVLILSTPTHSRQANDLITRSFQQWSRANQMILYTLPMASWVDSCSRRDTCKSYRHWSMTDSIHSPHLIYRASALMWKKQAGGLQSRMACRKKH